MTTDASISIDQLLPILRMLRKAGPQVESAAFERGRQILSEVGLKVRDLSDPELRVPHSLGVGFLEDAIRISSDPLFALCAGLSSQPGDYGVLECLVGCADTLKQAIYTSIRFLPLLHDGAEVSIFEAGDLVHWRHRVASGLVTSIGTNEYVIAGFLTTTQRQLNRHEPPSEIRFMHDAPGHANAYAELFRTRIRFNSEYNTIVFPRTALDLPMVDANRAFYNVLERYANELLKRLPIRQPFSRRVSQIVRERLSKGPTQIEVARALKMNERSLRRRLASEGLNHIEIIDRVRREVAIELLARQELNIADVASELGFSYSSAFNRAFKRWYGISPTDYRRKRVPADLYRFYNQDTQHSSRRDQP